MKKDKGTNSDLQNITHKIKDEVTRIPLTTGSELTFSRRVGSSSSTTGSHKAGDVISYDKETNHAWNVVELDSTWQFIETTWGAGHTDKNKKFNKKFTNYLFEDTKG
jgi:hypothetical protein